MFYPNHFATVTEDPLPVCAVNMGCPAGVGAAYSGQPFPVEVSARNVGNELTSNYKGRFARAVTLSAWSASGGGVPNPPVTPAVMKLVVGLENSNTPPVVPAIDFDNGTASIATPVYYLPNKFVSTAPGAPSTAPTTIFVRAVESADATVTSAVGASSQEGAMQIVSGRLLVPNAAGSDLVNLPLQIGRAHV